MRVPLQADPGRSTRIAKGHKPVTSPSSPSSAWATTSTPSSTGYHRGVASDSRTRKLALKVTFQSFRCAVRVATRLV